MLPLPKWVPLHVLGDVEWHFYCVFWSTLHVSVGVCLVSMLLLMLARWKGVSAGKPLDGECEVWPTSADGDPQATVLVIIKLPFDARTRIRPTPVLISVLHPYPIRATPVPVPVRTCWCVCCTYIYIRW